MNYRQKKNTQSAHHTPEPNAARVRDIMVRNWKPEASSLKREEWRQIVLERLG